MTQALTIPTLATLTQALDFVIGAWIHEKFGHTKSEKKGSHCERPQQSFRLLSW